MSPRRLSLLSSGLAFSLLLVAVGTGVHAQRSTSPATQATANVLFFGSSSVNGAFGMLIESEIEQAGFVVRREGRASTGLSRPDFYDWRAQIPRFGNLSALRGVVVYLGGNDAQAFRLREGEYPAGATEPHRWIQFRDEARWSEAYRNRTHQFVEAFCSAGARKVIIVPPVDGDQAGHAARIRRVQRLQIEGTAGTSCGVVANPSEVRLTAAEAGDGVHLSRAGARLVWSAIGPTILGALR